MQITVLLTRAILLTLLIPALSVGALGDQKQQEKKQENQAKTTSQDPLFKDPSLGSISEFRVLKPGMQGFRRARSLSFAEIINPFNIRKRGRFYGSVYHYHRNDFFDARNFFDPVGEKLPEFKRNQFGASMGAFVTGRLQVFGTYDGLRINKGSTIQSLVPTAAMKKGDFSSLSFPILDPSTGEPFPDNQIPQSRIHPVSAKMFPTIPDPNRDDPDRNFVNNQPSVENRDTITTRMDYELSPESNLFGNYQYSDGNELEVNPLPEFSTDADSANHDFSLTYNRNFGPNLVTTTNLSYNRVLLWSFQDTRFKRDFSTLWELMV